jgi:hypothetical protein
MFYSKNMFVSENTQHCHINNQTKLAITDEEI